MWDCWGAKTSIWNQCTHAHCLIYLHSSVIYILGTIVYFFSFVSSKSAAFPEHFWWRENCFSNPWNLMIICNLQKLPLKRKTEQNAPLNPASQMLLLGHVCQWTSAMRATRASIPPRPICRYRPFQLFTRYGSFSCRAGRLGESSGNGAEWLCGGETKEKKLKRSNDWSQP